MAQPSKTKQHSVAMELVSVGDQAVNFVTMGTIHLVRIPLDAWVELDRPQKVLVTVNPFTVLETKEKPDARPGA